MKRCLTVLLIASTGVMVVGVSGSVGGVGSDVSVVGVGSDVSVVGVGSVGGDVSVGVAGIGRSEGDGPRSGRGSQTWSEWIRRAADPSGEPAVAGLQANNIPTIDELQPVVNGPMPAKLNQSFYCEIDEFTYTLTLRGDGSAHYSGGDGVNLDGRHHIAQGALNIRLESGDGANSTAHVTAGPLLVAVRLLSGDGLVSICIAREHAIGDTLPVDVIVRCGRRHVGGEESNTFTLRMNGSAVWESLYELPGGIDTTRRQRLGTFVYIASADYVGMVFKDLSGEGLLFFTGTGSETQFQMTSAPDAGDGSQAAGQRCQYL
ncbi:MAG: hypothetical protein HKN42_12385 [Granulosicoccus sp.]|nr:hypothetical protein [Granulosicoccus sp.]